MENEKIIGFLNNVNWKAVIIFFIIMAAVLLSVAVARDTYTVTGIAVGSNGDNLVLQNVETSGWNLEKLIEEENLAGKKIRIVSTWRATLIYVKTPLPGDNFCRITGR